MGNGWVEGPLYFVTAERVHASRFTISNRLVIPTAVRWSGLLSAVEQLLCFWWSLSSFWGAG